MSARLLILIAIAGGLAVYFATKGPAAPKNVATTQKIDEGENRSPEEEAKLRERQKTLKDRFMAGENAAEPPKLSIRFEVDNSKGKNRFVFYISEEHGYYVETFDIDFWYKKTPDMTFEDSPLPLNHKILNRYLAANETLKDCIELTDAEMLHINNDMGTSENWGAVIRHYGRYRTKNPDPLPELDVYPTCR